MKIYVWLYPIIPRRRTLDIMEKLRGGSTLDLQIKKSDMHVTKDEDFDNFLSIVLLK